MNTSYDNCGAVVVLPRVSGGRLQEKSLRTWLAKSDLQLKHERSELLSRVLAVLGLPYPDDGLAALRMWGQTGDRPTVWIAAADPVYLEPRLDHLCLHAMRPGSVPSHDLRGLIDHLQETLADDRRFGFARLGSSCYLRSEEPLATAAVPAHILDGQVPGEFMPEGDDSALYRNVVSEIEMSLHDHAINQQRVADGEQPINSLWLWGGGFAPERKTRPLPPLFANDPILLGYWDSANAPAELWPGSISDCMASAPEGFVAVVPPDEESEDVLPDSLRQLRTALRERRFDRVTLIFRDGLRADIERSHALRFWRRNSSFLD